MCQREAVLLTGQAYAAGLPSAASALHPADRDGRSEEGPMDIERG